jgi:hypothetical protein
MAKATGEPSYLDLAEQFHDEFGLNYRMDGGMSWDNKVPGMQILLWELTQDEKYQTEVDAFFDYMLNEATYTPMGLLYLTDWGSVSAGVGQAHLALQVSSKTLNINLIFTIFPIFRLQLLVTGLTSCNHLLKAKLTTCWETLASPS